MEWIDRFHKKKAHRRGGLLLIVATVLSVRKWSRRKKEKRKRERRESHERRRCLEKKWRGPHGNAMRMCLHIPGRCVQNKLQETKFNYLSL